MKVEEQYLDALQNIESGIMRVFRADPSILDLDAKDAVAALMRHYRAEQEQRTPPDMRLGGQAQRIFDSVLPFCEWRLGRESPSQPPELGPGPEVPITLDEIGACLRRIQKSIYFLDQAHRAPGIFVLCRAEYVV